MTTCPSRAPTCLLLLSLLLLSAAATRPPPPYLVSSTDYNLTLALLRKHVKSVTALPGFRDGATPIFHLHPPGTRVFGTVIIFHGYFGSAFWSRLQARALFARKFNVLAVNLAGFAQNQPFFVSTVLRERAGYSKVRAAVRSDPVLNKLVSALANASTDVEQNVIAASVREPLMPRVFAALRRQLGPAEYAVAARALALLRPAPQQGDVPRDLRRLFLTGHQRFEVDPLDKLRLVQPLPGPVHVLSHSFGAAAALNLAARSRIIDRIAMFAPYFGQFQNPAALDLRHFLLVLGATNLMSEVRRVPGGFVSVPVRHTVAVTVAAGLTTRDEITNAVRESSKTYCFIAEEDMVVDVNHALEVCRSKVGGRAFVYPRRLGIGHGLPPEFGNKYSDALMEQVANFFARGYVDERSLLTLNKNSTV